MAGLEFIAVGAAIGAAVPAISAAVGSASRRFFPQRPTTAGAPARIFHDIDHILTPFTTQPSFLTYAVTTNKQFLALITFVKMCSGAVDLWNHTCEYSYTMYGDDTPRTTILPWRNEPATFDCMWATGCKLLVVADDMFHIHAMSVAVPDKFPRAAKIIRTVILPRIMSPRPAVNGVPRGDSWISAYVRDTPPAIPYGIGEGFHVKCRATVRGVDVCGTYVEGTKAWWSLWCWPKKIDGGRYNWFKKVEVITDDGKRWTSDKGAYVSVVPRPFVNLLRVGAGECSRDCTVNMAALIEADESIMAQLQAA